MIAIICHTQWEMSLNQLIEVKRLKIIVTRFDKSKNYKIWGRPFLWKWYEHICIIYQ